MITLIFLVIGFLITGGAFGAQVIVAFELAQYWLWFVAGLATIVGLVIIAGLTFWGGTKAQDEKFGKLLTSLSAGAGGILGVLIAFILMAGSYIELWLSYYIIDNTPIDATAFAEFPQNTQYAIYAFFALIVLSAIRSFGSNKK